MPPLQSPAATVSMATASHATTMAVVKVVRKVLFSVAVFEGSQCATALMALANPANRVDAVLCRAACTSVRWRSVRPPVPAPVSEDHCLRRVSSAIKPGVRDYKRVENCNHHNGKRSAEKEEIDFPDFPSSPDLPDYPIY
ncbi:hypothetical protein PFISCL1PPCAC_29115 [Pristionchus fissidentatus]|uniref:Uncharacterized protein n=1 Tax=Pristionchus fissidentatus TaxID=1538716 RepID=A0AAV5X2J6_9BILA|nr:hypothetical protein PFISCL1PPCAC_29115 [Pristionchus fissidentatus]